MGKRKMPASQPRTQREATNPFGKEKLHEPSKDFRNDLFANSMEKSSQRKALMKNKQGKVISKKRYATGRKNFKNGGIAKWSKAVTEARKNLGITGFYAVKKGTALYKEARKIYDA